MIMENKNSSKAKQTVWIDGIPVVGSAKRFTFLWFRRFKWAAIQISSAIILLALLSWLSVFLYGSFHRHYMPRATSFERPIYLNFRTDCDSNNALCSFPYSNISLVTVSGNELLLRGQPYIIKLELEMPESYVNQNLGMFMVQIQFYTVHGEVVYTTSRAAMMQFKSMLYRIFETVWLLPSFFLGSSIQKQTIVIEMANEYLVDTYRPTIGAYLEVQSKRIEIYNVSLKINARLFGLRYLLYYWPTLSAIIGVATNFFFLALIAVFSYAAYVSNTTKALNLSSSAPDPTISPTRKRKRIAEEDNQPDSTSSKPVEVELTSQQRDAIPSIDNNADITVTSKASDLDVLPHYTTLPSGDDEPHASRNYFVGSTLRHRPVTKDDNAF